MTVVIRFAVESNVASGEYISHRRFDLRKGSHLKWGSPRTARVWARKSDAEATAAATGGRVVTVVLKFGAFDRLGVQDVISDIWNTAR